MSNVSNASPPNPNQSCPFNTTRFITICIVEVAFTTDTKKVVSIATDITFYVKLLFLNVIKYPFCHRFTWDFIALLVVTSCRSKL
jgi:hypothetical protein